jgi:hypothetical protein
VDISTSTGPSWTEIVTAVSTAVLALAAIVAGCIAWGQFKFWDAMERRKATFALIRDYTAPVRLKNHSAQTEVALSPMMAYANLVTGDLNTIPMITPPGQPIRVVDSLAETRMSYFVLRNYLAEIIELSDRKIIDRNLLLGRAGTLISSAVETLKRFQALVGTTDDSQLFDALTETVRTFDAKHPRSTSW